MAIDIGAILQAAATGLGAQNTIRDRRSEKEKADEVAQEKKAAEASKKRRLAGRDLIKDERADRALALKEDELAFKKSEARGKKNVAADKSIRDSDFRSEAQRRISGGNFDVQDIDALGKSLPAEMKNLLLRELFGLQKTEPDKPRKGALSDAQAAALTFQRQDQQRGDILDEASGVAGVENFGQPLNVAKLLSENTRLSSDTTEAGQPQDPNTGLQPFVDRISPIGGVENTSATRDTVLQLFGGGQAPQPIEPPPAPADTAQAVDVDIEPFIKDIRQALGGKKPPTEAQWEQIFIDNPQFLGLEQSIIDSVGMSE